MTATTDVRQWLREQGHDIGVRGAIPRHLQDEYDSAHQPAPAKTVPGEVLDDPSMGVTEADFPPDDDLEPEARDKPAAKGRERRPRAVKPAPPARKQRLTERIFGGGSGGKGRPKHARVPLGDWAEETWTDLAWLAEPVPPLSKILTLQAPYAGVVFDDAVRGTPVDSLLQPVARYSGAFRALNGLAGPPVYVAMICATGQRVQVGVTEHGEPVFDYDGRTKAMFAGLKYSLLQMTKIGEQHIGQIQQRAQEAAERSRIVDAMIESIFGMEPGPAYSPPAAAAPAAEPGANGYRYPESPVMDGTGADPGRL